MLTGGMQREPAWVTGEVASAGLTRFWAALDPSEGQAASTSLSVCGVRERVQAEES